MARKVTKAKKSAIMKGAAQLRKQGMTPRQALKNAWRTASARDDAVKKR